MKTFRVNMHPSLEYWYEVEVMLPGAKTCRIYEHPRLVYRCTWNTAANLAAETVRAKLIQDLQDALGDKDWTVHASSEATQVTRFQPVNPQRNPLWEVRMDRRKQPVGVEVVLYPVDRWTDSP